jgi:nucleoside 2-deoxyribosyltransferase
MDPWEGLFGPAIAEAGAIQDWPSRVHAFRDIAAQIGKANEEMISSCDSVLGVLDGAEMDSDIASEIGFTAAL